jgi:hypothetical protein
MPDSPYCGLLSAIVPGRNRYQPFFSTVRNPPLETVSMLLEN